MRLKTWHCLVLVTLAVLVAYYPGLHAGYNSVDDLKMVRGIDQAGPLHLVHLFLPSGTSYYYRPLTILSYIFDRDAWGSIPSFMHLENILLHLACAWVVFAITLQLLPLWGTKERGPALFAGLVFALHPLATESVCWISGRTDPLMALFLLLAVLLTLVALTTGRFVASFGAGFALLLACLAKEVGVFILPGLLWMIAVFPGEGDRLGRLRQRWSTFLAPIAGAGGYFVLRHLAIARDTGVKTALKGVAGGDFDLLNKMRIAFKVYGFYLKKLFVPWPLNFAIVDISGWYVVAGVLLALALLYLAWRADLPGAFGLMSFFVLSPALLVVFGEMTWTPVAERYLYTSVALFAPLVAYLVLRLRKVLTGRVRSCCDLALTALLLVFFVTTLHRAWIWQDNVRLYRDTVAKSPDFVAAKTELASALLRRGKSVEAKAILEGLHREGVKGGYVNDDINLASIYLTKGDPDGARRIILPLLGKNPKKQIALLQELIRINDQRLGKINDPAAKAAIQRESLGWLLEEQRIRPTPFTLYRIGKKYLTVGNDERALEFFQKAYAQAPQDAFYRGAAATFIKHIEGS